MIPIVELAKMFKNIIFVKKGVTDIIARDSDLFECRVEGGKKRAAGQGDLLAGMIGAFISRVKDEGTSAMLGAVFSACYVIRSASCLAFESESYSLLTSDILQYLGTAIKQLLSISADRRVGDGLDHSC